jgi:hypothetical protein
MSGLVIGWVLGVLCCLSFLYGMDVEKRRQRRATGQEGADATDV